MVLYIEQTKNDTAEAMKASEKTKVMDEILSDSFPKVNLMQFRAVPNCRNTELLAKGQFSVHS